MTLTGVTSIDQIDPSTLVQPAKRLTVPSVP
jgi:isopentenyl diphosphate isomerase/L-lactate dehydrogenase-like FMN-dependent dehydrogenase